MKLSDVAPSKLSDLPPEDDTPDLATDVGHGLARGAQTNAAAGLSGSALMALSGDTGLGTLQIPPEMMDTLRKDVSPEKMRNAEFHDKDYFSPQGKILGGDIEEPHTGAGKVAEVASEFATNPLSYIGAPEFAAGKAVAKEGAKYLGKRAAGSAATGAASETAGELADPVGLGEPARLGTAVLAGPVAAGGAKAAKSLAGAASGAEKLTIGTVGDALINMAQGEGGYGARALEATRFKIEPLTTMPDIVDGALRQRHIYGGQVPEEVRKMFNLEEMQRVAGVGGDAETVPFQFVNHLKTRLLEKFNISKEPTERLAMHVAIDAIDGYMEQNAGGATGILKRANENYRAGRLINEIRETMEEAIQRSKQTGLGANNYNVIRQRIDKLRTNPRSARYLNDDEKEEIKKIAAGGAMGNFLNHVAKLGPDHPLSGWGTALVTDMLHGHGLTLAQLAAGALSQSMAKKLVLSQIGDLEQRIYSRTPMAKDAGFKYEPKEPKGVSGSALRALRATAPMTEGDSDEAQ